jgi:hypothetical protein
MSSLISYTSIYVCFMICSLFQTSGVEFIRLFRKSVRFNLEIVVKCLDLSHLTSYVKRVAHVGRCCTRKLVEISVNWA